MKREYLRAKIHNATVTEADVEYIGSLTLDLDLMEAADLKPFERVDVYNVTGGQRFSTYIIEGPRSSGKVCRVVDLIDQTEPYSSFHALFERRQHAVRPDSRFCPSPAGTDL